MWYKMAKTCTLLSRTFYLTTCEIDFYENRKKIDTNFNIKAIFFIYSR